MRCWLPLGKEKRRRWQNAAAQLAERSGDPREAKEAVKSKAFRMQVGRATGMTVQWKAHESWGVLKVGMPQKWLFSYSKWLTMNDLGVHLFSETPILFIGDGDSFS